jgi:hypothetical protein
VKISKLYKSFVFLLLVLGFVSCQNDVKEEKSEVIVLDTTDVVEKTIESIDSPRKDNNEISEEIKKEAAVMVDDVAEVVEPVVEQNQSVTEEDIVKEKEREELLREETAEDLESELSKKVNVSVNPDNDNGAFEIKEDAQITVVPIITEDDKSKYYVQFTIKINKISKVDLSKFFPDTQKIYVVQHKGLYKYSVGQFDDEKAAAEYKKVVDKEFKFTKSEVATYSEAW